jgi:hypothetical protein
MAHSMSVIARALYLLSFLPLISSLHAETSLKPRQGGFDTGIWIFTFYGWPDSFSPNVDCVNAANHNPPEGSSTIAYPGCVHLGNARGKFAGGSGTYSNPLTVAAHPGSTVRLLSPLSFTLHCSDICVAYSYMWSLLQSILTKVPYLRG